MSHLQICRGSAVPRSYHIFKSLIYCYINFISVTNCTITTTTKIPTTKVSNQSNSTTSTFERSTKKVEMTTNSPKTHGRSTRKVQTSPDTNASSQRINTPNSKDSSAKPTKDFAKTTSNGKFQGTTQKPTKDPNNGKPERVSSNVKQVVIIAVPLVCAFVFLIVILILCLKKMKKTNVVCDAVHYEMKGGKIEENSGSNFINSAYEQN